MTIHIRRRLRHVSLSPLIAFFMACGADSIVAIDPDGRNHTVTASVGQEIQVTLGNIGSAVYKSPPQISSSIVTFLGVEVVPPFNPGGPTQRFRFKAVGAGRAVIEFTRAIGDSVVAIVQDTVDVR